MLVFNDYNQAQLDLQYNVRHHVPDFQNYLSKWESQSKETGQKRRIIKNIKYGDFDREYVDVFPADSHDAKTLIFIHGGYWRTFDTSLFYFIAEAFSQYNITTILINYPLTPHASMDLIVASCHRAMEWLHHSLPKFNGDPERCFMVGYSAGAHLAAMLSSSTNNNIGMNFARDLCLISGLFDLIPLQLSYLNESLQMNSAIAERNSPILRTPGPQISALIAVGTDETEEFNRQSRTLYAAWRGTVQSANLMEIPHLNHFSILDSLSDTRSVLHTSIRNRMGIH